MTDSRTDQPLTDDEKQTLRDAAYGAVFLVTNADPGVLDLVRESFAASEVLARSSPLVREALAGGGLPDLPGPPAEMGARVLPALARSISILKAKAPAEVDRYRAWVLEACAEAAAAAGGIQDAESAELSKIRSALR